MCAYMYVAALCGPGNEDADGDGNCEQCLQGYYKNGTSDAKCDQCPDLLTTATTGSISADDCFSKPSSFGQL